MPLLRPPAYAGSAPPTPLRFGPPALRVRPHFSLHSLPFSGLLVSALLVSGILVSGLPVSGLPFPGPARPLSVAPSVSKVTELAWSSRLPKQQRTLERAHHEPSPGT